MKKITCAFLALLAASVAGAQELPKLAVLNPTSSDEAITQDIAGTLSDKISESIFSSRCYNILDRAARDQIWEERNFQISSGEVKSDEIKQVGKGLGADYVAVTKISKVGSLYSMSSKIINVETLEVVAQASSESEASLESLLQLATYCGELLAQQSPAGPKTASAQAEAKPAASPPPSLSGQEALRPLLDKHSFLNSAGQRQINGMLGSLDQGTRYSLFREYKKSFAFGNMLLNLVPLIPIGSMVQQDWSGAGWLFSFEAGGVGLCLVSLGSGSLDAARGWGSVAIIAYAWGLIQPYVFESSWNGKLSKALGVIASAGPADIDVRLAEGADGAPRIESVGVSLVRLGY